MTCSQPAASGLTRRGCPWRLGTVYYIHYVDFNKRLDEWVSADRLDVSNPARILLPRPEGERRDVRAPLHTRPNTKRALPAPRPVHPAPRALDSAPPRTLDCAPPRTLDSALPRALNNAHPAPCTIPKPPLSVHPG